MTDTLSHRARAAQSDCRRHRRATSRRFARRAQPPATADLLVCSELALIGYPPEDLVLRPAVLEATRRAVEELAADTANGTGDAGDDAVAATAARLYNAVVLLDGGQHRRGPLQARAAELRRVRREARLRRRAAARRRRLSRRSARRADLRGHVVSRRSRAISPTRGAELLIVPNGSPFERDEAGSAHRAGRRARAGNRAAAGLRQPGRRAGRARVRRRLVRGRRDGRLVARLPVWKRSDAVDDAGRATPTGMELRAAGARAAAATSRRTPIRR